MKLRTIAILAVVLIVLAIAVTQMQKRLAVKKHAGPLPGDPVLTNFDANSVVQMNVSTRSATNVFLKKNGTWVIATLYDYPADFSRIVEQLRHLADMKVGQVIRSRAEEMDEFGLSPGKATLVTLQTGSSQVMAKLAIGMPRMSKGEEPYGGYPDGNYLRVNDGPVLRVSQKLPGWPSSGPEWMQRDVIAVPQQSVSEVSVTSKQGSYTVQVQGMNQYSMDGLGEGEEVDKDVAGRLTRALEAFNFLTVVNPAETNKDLGFGKPDQFVMKTKDGLTYTILLGGYTPTRERYARVKVSYQTAQPPPTLEDVRKEMPPPNEEALKPTTTNNYMGVVNAEFMKRKADYARKTGELQKKASDQTEATAKWTFVLNELALGNMNISRSQLIKKLQTAEEPEEQATTNPPKAK